MKIESQQSRVSMLQAELAGLTAHIRLPRLAAKLVEERRKSHWFDAEEKIGDLQRNMRTLRAALVGLLAALFVFWAGVLLSVFESPCASQSLEYALVLVAACGIAIVCYRLRCIRFDVWLRTNAAHSGVACELLGLAHSTPVVRRYIQIAAELFHEPRGLDVLVARRLQEHERNCGEVRACNERAAVLEFQRLGWGED